MKFTRVLKKGMHGSDIKWVQEQLNLMGLYNSSANGFFNQETQDSVRKLQTKLGHSSNGVVNMILWNNIEKRSVVSKREVSDVASVSVSNGVKIYDRIQNSKSDKLLSKKSKIDIGFSGGSGDAEFSCDSIHNISYFIGDDGTIFRALDDMRNDSDSIKVGLCNWGEIILNRDNRYINCVGMEITDVEKFGEKYYQKITQMQRISLNDLVVYLEDRYGIGVDYSTDYLKL